MKAIANDTSWMTGEAYCRDHPDSDMWLADGSHAIVIQREAARLCRTECPLVEACLAYALKDRSIKGVWGGTTERDRMRLRRGLHPVARGGRPSKR